MLEKTLRMGMLYDFYGSLLTKKQRQCVEMYYLNDYSLSEIADDLGISRQAVYDLLRRVESILNGYEIKLQLVQKFQNQKKTLVEIDKLLNAAECTEDSRLRVPLEDAKRLLRKLLD